MAATQVSQFVRELRIVLEQRDVANLADAELWTRYVRARDEAAFETLVKRHGPMAINVILDEGEFTLVHGMAGEGWFHIVLTDPENDNRWFANIYFGTGENVWRPKP